MDLMLIGRRRRLRPGRQRVKSDSGTVVFVNASDLAALTNRSRQRISQLVIQPTGASTGEVLPPTRVRINGNPAWRLDRVAQALEQSGYTLLESVLAQLKNERAVSAATIPVGISEAANVLDIPAGTLRSRSTRGYVAAPLFRLGREKVWDLDSLIADTLSRGFSINDAAAARWREQNSDAAELATREVIQIIRIRATVPAALTDVGAALKIDGHIRELLLPSEEPPLDGVRVLGVEVQPAE
jgi:hypothetical protein